MTTNFSNITFSNKTENSTTEVKNTKADMTSSYIGLAFGCTFAFALMMIVCFLCVKTLRSSSKGQSQSRSRNVQKYNAREPERPKPSMDFVASISYSVERRKPSITYPSSISELVEIRRTPKSPMSQIIARDESTCLLSVYIEFLKTLNLHAEYFNHKYDRCYCSRHYSNSKPKTYVSGGYKYTIPCGWMRFGLKFNRLPCENEDIFKTWPTSFYGTSIDQLEQILCMHFVPFPGDRLLNQEIFSPKFFDQGICYTSPSIHYTSNLKVCQKHIFISKSNKIYEVQVILQCKQKPNTFEVNHGQSGLCNIISANEIKWKTRTRSTILPYGLLIHMIKQ
ncbi:unnamed protein product [Rotaria sp. Silwood2]|nr:unnamed protein product [Rotaria sp. Silwood2]CAF3968456.1 unnamed protein product [Rotaria sp. Silwood2]